MTLEKKKSLPTNTLRVNALVVIDQILAQSVGNSSQIVQEFFPLVNHILGSVGIEIRISDVLQETSSIRFDFVQLLDEKTGVVNLWQRTPDFLYGVQNAGQDHDIVLVASGLDIYDTWPFRKDIGGIAQMVAWPLPFFRIHDCRYKTAIIEVTNLTDPVSKWTSAWAAAHEVAHLIGTTQGSISETRAVD